jgi:folate-binding protein YgfZ
MALEHPGGTNSNTSGTMVISSNELTPRLVRALRESAVVARAEVAVVDVVGSRAVQCLQGLLTCDLEGAGEHAFLYGALLSAKGMIQCDMWITRRSDHVTLFVPLQGRETLLAAFKRFLPPRMAKVEEASEARTVFRVAGAHAHQLTRSAGLAVPAPGKAQENAIARLGRPEQDAPFCLQLDCNNDRSDELAGHLAATGIKGGNGYALELVRVLAGWPHLGAEIDEKTLPQEVRLDDLGAVSYSKGCYLGQETVARLHFRGHVNKRMQGLIWETAPDPTMSEIAYDDKPVGRMTSVVSLDQNDLHLGLGMVRSTIESGSPVTAAGSQATTVDLPFSIGL